jgi:hypothetical protein
MTAPLSVPDSWQTGNILTCESWCATCNKPLIEYPALIGTYNICSTCLPCCIECHDPMPHPTCCVWETCDVCNIEYLDGSGIHAGCPSCAEKEWRAQEGRLQNRLSRLSWRIRQSFRRTKERLFPPTHNIDNDIPF